MRSLNCSHFFILLFSIFIIDEVKANGPFDDIPVFQNGFENITVATDTIPFEDRDGDFINDNTRNPFDLQDPKDVVKEVEYDPISGNYIIRERIGDQYFRAPTYLTFEEFVEWQAGQDEQTYFNTLAGVSDGNRSKSGIVDPMAKIDIKEQLIDRLFGGNQITIEPQGNIDLVFSLQYSNIENPNYPARVQKQYNPDFNMNIKTNIQGKIGDKMDLNFNWDNNATFNFDQQLKLAYDSEKWSEDEILKKVEAGNVSFPLRSSLIQGTQNLFGLKTEMQFGHLTLTAIAAEQRSNQDNLTIQSGGTIQEYEIYPDEYDENRHFFLSHYNRNSYESSLQDLPYINSPFEIVNLQVWVTNDRQETQQLRDIAAIADLGVGQEENLTNNNFSINPINPTYRDYTGQYVLADNVINTANEILSDNETRKIINTSTNLKNKYGLEQGQDYEILKARRLNPSEYSFHPELGFVSLNVRLRPNQVLAVSYQYTYTYNGDNIYQVGEFADDVTTQDSLDVIFTKLLKSSVQNTDEPNWDLMMKNVYPLGASQINSEDFKFDIFFENNRDGSLTRYIPDDDSDLPTIPLLDIFNLDNLNAVNDPQPDGIFDFVPGVTILPRTGSVIFPVLEPFGNSLYNTILEETSNPSFADSLAYQELYDSTIIAAREQLQKNRFLMRARFKSSISSEISLGAFNIPRGSVTIRAGSRVLVEGVDYEINYGIGTVKILNDSYLSAGTPINVSYENNNLFGIQKTYLIGGRADYEVNKNFNIGATYMHLFEQIGQQKINIGDDPISNRIFGFDLNYANEIPWMTRALDKLPFYSTSEMSNINTRFEMAYLRPGHSRAINNGGDDKGGIVLVDDFEGSASGIPLGNFNFNEWSLASTPSEFVEFENTNDLSYNANRARLNWYVLDNGFINNEDQTNPYTRLVPLEDLFENVELTNQQFNYLRSFDLSFYPSERGPYNFDPPNGFNVDGTQVSAGSYWDESTDQMRLNDPASRWGGVMRFINNNDFQALNVEYIEFWMLNPFMERPDPSENPINGETGYLHFNLGNVSEDILRDNLQFYEHGMEAEQPVPYQTSTWGKAPLVPPKTPNFDFNYIQQQDVGLDGLTDSEELENYQDYIMEVLQEYPTSKLQFDPSNDNFVNFDNDSIYNENTQSVLERLRKFNNPQGNTPTQATSTSSRGKYSPDVEDMNNNQSLDQGENYYDYEIELENENGFIKRDPGNDFIREVRTVQNPQGPEETWYRFRIPINSPTKTIGSISGFRSIQFVRTYLNGFEQPKTIRMGNLELIRNQWRRLLTGCADGQNPATLTIDAVSLQENSKKDPFNYVIPPGVQLEYQFTNSIQTLLNEKSLALNFKNLGKRNFIEGVQPDCAASVYKLDRIDMRLFEELQLFIHGESMMDNLQDGDLEIYVRLGKDFSQNFYEYTIPLVLSRDPGVNYNNPEEIWKEVNKMKLILKKLSNLKLARNAAGIDGTYYYSQSDPDYPQNQIAVLGNPSLGLIKGIQMGVRNINSDTPVEGEVWFNELRLIGLEEKGGVAGLGQVDIQMADLGAISGSASYNSIGYGSIDQKLAERSQEEVLEYNIGANVNVNKLLPGNLPVSIPVFAQHTNVIKTPRWDPYDLDIELRDKIDEFPDREEELRELAVEKTTINTINATNVKVNRTKADKKPMPWDISNVSASYAFTRTDHSDPIIEQDRIDDHTGSLDYVYSRPVNYWQPFKGVTNKNLTLIKNINFNFLPNRFAVKNTIKRYQSVRTYRLPDFIDYTFYDKRFTWDRNYTLNWDLTKGLKFSFDANNQSTIDELRQVGVGGNAVVNDEYGQYYGDVLGVSKQDYKDYLWENLKNFGRARDYGHNMTLQYTLPTRDIPFMDWTSIRASVSTGYVWDGASLRVDTLGNIVSNFQNRQMSATLNFDKLYRKSDYLKKIERGKNTNSRVRSRSPRGNNQPQTSKGKDEDKKKKDREPTLVERALIRPLLSLRTINLSYGQNLGTTVPGIVRRSSILGMDSQFDAPGWEFVAGLQPDISAANSNNWLYQGASKGWFTTSRFLNNQVMQNDNQTLELKVDLEIYKDLNIDVDFRKSYSNNHIEEFKTLEDKEFHQLALRNMGSFEVNYMTMNTLFDRDYTGLFEEFEDNRVVMSQRLPNEQNATNHELYPEYAEGYGRQSTDVLLPTFLATYAGKSVETFPTNFVDEISAWSYIPTPNWSLNYNGLSKLPWFQDVFSNVSVKHGYRSVLSVNSFMSDPQYDFINNPYDEVNDISKNYFTRFDIPQITISEEFSPLIGVDVRMKNDMNFNMEYRKSRQLGIDFYAKELVENQAEEFVFGAGMVFKNVDIPFLTRSNKNGKKRGSRGNKDEDKKVIKSKVSGFKGNDLTFNLDFAYRDDVVYNHTLDQSVPALATRGTRSYRLSPNLEYDVNPNLTLRLFFDYNRSIPKTTLTFPSTRMEGGITVRFNLTEF